MSSGNEKWSRESKGETRTAYKRVGKDVRRADSRRKERARQNSAESKEDKAMNRNENKTRTGAMTGGGLLHFPGNKRYLPQGVRLKSTGRYVSFVAVTVVRTQSRLLLTQVVSNCLVVAWLTARLCGPRVATWEFTAYLRLLLECSAFYSHPPTRGVFRLDWSKHEEVV